MNDYLVKALQILIITITFSCTNKTLNLKNSRIIYIYNPLKDELKVKIDHNEVKLPPTASSPIQLNHGPHLFEFGEIKDSFHINENSNLVINPLRDTLILEEIIYIPGNQEEQELYEKDYTIKFNMFNINNLQYYGPFELKNDLYFNDWAYGPGHPVNLQLTEFSSVKPNLDTTFSVKKIYTVSEFIENQTSINHTEEYIAEFLPQYLTILSNDINIEVIEDALFAGTEKNNFELADIHVTAEKKLHLTIWEKFNPSIHGEKKEVKFIINDCTVEIDDKIMHSKEVHGISVSKSESLVLIVK